MNLQQRVGMLTALRDYMLSDAEDWQIAKNKAFAENNWFTTEFVNLAVRNIAENYLRKDKLQKIIDKYSLPEENTRPKKVGIVMAGNIPLVGFHDLLCSFLTGHYSVVKPSSKDEVLIKHLITKITEWYPKAEPFFIVSELLKKCDAYIATGSNNTSRYFEYYFRNYPSLIRKNRTSVAILTGKETLKELQKLADDVHQYFGLGCRNVTKLYVPQNFDFVPLLEAFTKYSYFINHNKYKNNYDYNLAIHIINNRFYMTSGSLLLVEDQSDFSPISQLNYEYYANVEDVQKRLQSNDNIQCVVGRGNVPFGEAQCPGIIDFADQVDTIKFLMNLHAEATHEEVRKR
ncbi:MAG: acyl-CoA reductase [Chitinophagaceae bacterium]|nr:acyl-CoA reductase [Chitinophagaceae bacterium]